MVGGIGSCYHCCRDGGPAAALGGEGVAYRGVRPLHRLREPGRRAQDQGEPGRGSVVGHVVQASYSTQTANNRFVRHYRDRIPDNSTIFLIFGFFSSSTHLGL